MNKGKRFLFIKSVENEHFLSAFVIGGFKTVNCGAMVSEVG